MATPPQYNDGRKSPSGRKTPHPLTTTFFNKSKKSGEARSPTLQSPTTYMRSPSNTQGTGKSAEIDEAKAESGTTPQSLNAAPNTARPKKLAPNSFNTHYRTISRSMNDLGNIFSRGRSPPNRDPSPRRTGGSGPLNPLPEGRRRGTEASPRLRTMDNASVPSISVMQHGEQTHKDPILKEGWVNVIDSMSIKKGPLRDVWKLQHAVVIGGHLMLYKPSSSLQIRSFDINAVPASPPRPQSAPATATPTFGVSSLRHKSTSKHPEIIEDDYGRVKSGSVEALCHELMFTGDDEFVQGATRTLPAWAGPETALSVLTELSTLKDLSPRIAHILSLLVDFSPGLLLEAGCYNAARLLIEKGITPHNPGLARDLRAGIEARAVSLHDELMLHVDRGYFRRPMIGLSFADNPTEPMSPAQDAFSTLSTSLTTDEFMRVNPEIFASQVHLFHLKYMSVWNPEDDLSLLLASPHLPPPAQRCPLIFTTANMHFLGERVLSHILCGDSAMSVDRRASVLSQWVKVANLVLKKGDMVGYMAIMMAVLSTPVMRLRETWSLVDDSMFGDIEQGAKIMRHLDRRRLEEGEAHSEGCVLVPDLGREDISPEEVVPFFGDLCRCMDEAYESRTRNVEYLEFLQATDAIIRALKNWREEWPVTKLQFKSRGKRLVKEVEQLQKCLNALNSNNQTPLPTNSAAFFDMSLACEPSASGLYLLSHYHQRLPLSTGASVPLVFTDCLASFSLFDRDDTLAISGSLHKKTPSSGLASPSYGPGQYPGPHQSIQSLRPPTSSSQPPLLRRTRSFPPPSKDTAQTTGYDELDFTTRERTAGLHCGDNGMLRAIRDVAGVGQQLFYSKDGELVLKSITDDGHPSRPSSLIETTSKRVSGASRRISSHNCSDTPSPRISDQPERGDLSTPAVDKLSLDTHYLSVVPKGGTLERLVDILVLGVEDFSKRMNGPDPESTSADNAPLLRMNMDVFTITFFATFRSYCSPIVLIDYLKKRLLGSKSAATISDNESDDVVFPDWTGVDHVSDESIDWSLVAKIHMGILEAMNTWISEFFIDFHGDQSLGDSFMSFLAIASKELSYWKNLSPEHADLQKQADQINSLWHDIRAKFANLNFSPLRYQSQKIQKSLVELGIPPIGNIAGMEEFVDKLEGKVLESFKTIKLVDWMIAFEIFETQSAEPLGFFVPKVTLLSLEDDEVFQDIFFVLRNIRRGNRTVSVLETLPKSLRELCALRSEIINWILLFIVDIRLTLERRAQRIAVLLKCLAISRKRMSGMDLYEDAKSRTRQQVPSLVASAIATALVRPESRAFGHAWLMAVRINIGPATQIDTLEQTIPKDIEGISPTKPLTPCVGWIIERLLEIVCHVPNMVVENNRLINFDKRRYVYNFINNFTHVSAGPLFSELDTLGGPGLSLPAVRIPDLKSIKETANKENQPIRHLRVKVFWRLLHQEQEKIRRDAKQREAIERHQRHQLRAEHRRHPAALNLQPADKRSNKRLAVNSIFKAVRPLSMALGGWTPPQSSARIVAPTDLPALRGVEHGKKPSLTIDLTTATVSCNRTTRDRLMWKIKGEHSLPYLFQATTEKELEEWLRTIANIRGVAAIDAAESIGGLTVLSNNRIPQPVYGVSLDELCRRDRVKVPLVVEALLSEIETRGINEVGIYRVPGSLSSINALKSTIDSGEEVRMDDDRWYDINAIAGAFKLLMRELPDKALGDEALYELRNVTAEISDDGKRAAAYREVMLRLPINNYNFLRRVYLHFSRIASNAAINKMHAVNLAIVFGMGLSQNNMPMGISPDLGLYQTMVKVWITHADIVFPEIEDEGESGSVNQAESVEIQPSEPSSPALEHASPRASLDDGRFRMNSGSEKGSG